MARFDSRVFLVGKGVTPQRRRLTSTCTDRGMVLGCTDRLYHSPKTCSSCGTVKAKLEPELRFERQRLPEGGAEQHRVGLGRGAGNGVRFAA